MKTKAAAVTAMTALVLGLGTARAQMMGGMMGGGYGMMGGHMAEMMGPGLAGACWADLGDLGLSADVRKSLEDKHFELRKKVIRGMADIQVLRLELTQALENRSFDLSAADKLVTEITGKEAELRSAHLMFLRDLGSILSDEQWDRLQEREWGMMHGRMMPMMGVPGMTPYHVPGGMMQGPRGGPGMMMQPGDSSREAEKFFEKK